MWAVVTLWACSTFGLGCDARHAPDLVVIQAAYNRELSTGNSRHDSDLKILEARCDDQPAVTGYLCQVTFMSTKDRAERLYYDIISIDQTGDGWALKSGLCKR